MPQASTEKRLASVPRTPQKFNQFVLVPRPKCQQFSVAWLLDRQKE